MATIPRTGLRPEDLEAGQYMIQGGQQGAVTNIPSFTPPRPAGASIAPRPDMTSVASAGVSGIKPPAFSQASTDALKKFRSVQEAGTKGARIATRERIEGAPAREAARIKAQEEKKAADQLAFEREKELALAPEQLRAQAQRDVANIKASVDREEIRTQAQTEAQKLEAEERIATADREVDRQLAENELLTNTRDNDTKMAVAEMQQETAKLEALRDPTPKQKLAIENVKSNKARLVGIETDIASELSDDPNPSSNKALRALLMTRDAILQSNLQQSKLMTGDDVVSEAEIVATESTPEETATLGGVSTIDTAGLPAATASNAVNVNGDGSTDRFDVQEINEAIRFSRQMEVAKKRGLPAYEDAENQAQLIRAQGIVKAYKSKVDEEGRRVVNGA